MRLGLMRWVFALALIALAQSAFAGWTTTILRPPVEAQVYAIDVSDGDVLLGVHYDVVNGDQSMIWHASTSSYASPVGVGGNSTVFAVSGQTLVGETEMRARKWANNGLDSVDLSPDGSSQSVAYDVHDRMVAGWANFPSSGFEYYTSDHAGYWDDSGRWYDLHPAEYRSSMALATDGIRQAGCVRLFFEPSILLDGPQNACVWSGTADSAVNLNPSGAWCSEARGLWGDTQVGWAAGPGMNYEQHAGLWKGTAESWVDLHPAGAMESTAYDVFGEMQVGWYRIASTCQGYRAVAWWGTSSSATDLHQFLPDAYSTSNASAIGAGPNGEIWVVGDAQNTLTGLCDAVIWHYTPVPEPASFLSLGAGLISIGLAACRKRQIHH